MTSRHTTTQILAIKAAARWRDRYRCRRCGMRNQVHLGLYGKSLHVHRLRPGSYYSVPGCVTLCYRCHGPQPKREAGQPDLDSARTGVPLMVYLPPEVRDALGRAVAASRRSLTTEVIICLEQYLTGLGFWPLPPADQPPLKAPAGSAPGASAPARASGCSS